MPCDADKLPHNMRLLSHIMPKNLRRTRIGCKQRGQHPDSSGFAGTIGPQHPVNTAGLHLQIYAVHSPVLTEGLNQAAGRNRPFPASGVGISLLSLHFNSSLIR
ncbi:hypothetical protein D3C75_527860 [compost metagenome]